MKLLRQLLENTVARIYLLILGDVGEPLTVCIGFRLHYNTLKTEKQEKTEKLTLPS